MRQSTTNPQSRAVRPRGEEARILEMIREGEHENQDFKFEISDAFKIARSLSAFANTTGGRLLIGVKDNGRIAGIQGEEEAYMVEAAAQGCITGGRLRVEISQVPVQGRTIVVAQVLESAQKPVMARTPEGGKWAYVRVRDENILASPVHLALWRQAVRERTEAFRMGDGEESLLRALGGSPDGLTLGQAVRTARMTRSRCIEVLAHLARFGAVTIRHDGHAFRFLQASGDSPGSL